MNKADFSEFVRTKRKELNMTQEELAEKLCVSRNVVAKWESGLRYPDLETSQRLVEVFLITPTELYEQSSINDRTPAGRFKTVGISVILILLLACGIIIPIMLHNQEKKPPAVIDETSETDDNDMSDDKIIRWFDYYDGDDINNVNDIEIEKLPGLQFLYDDNQILISGKYGNSSITPNLIPYYALNAYFADITGDKVPELCVTVSVGSGICDTRILVCDFEENDVYEMSDRTVYDYVLKASDGELRVEKRSYEDNTLVESGVLKYKDGGIYIESDR